MRMLRTLMALAALGMAAPATASTTITFEDYLPIFQPNPFSDSGATFSNAGGFYVSDYLSDGNQELCPIGQTACDATFGIVFASAISGLTFRAMGDDSASTLTVLLTLADLSSPTATFTLDGNPFTYDLIDLSSYGNILDLQISTNDFWGLGYDDFTLSDAVTATPEPATWLMLVLGFGLMGAVLRRRRHASAVLA